MEAEEIRSRIKTIDATTDWDEGERVLRELGGSRSLLPFLLEAYPTFRKYQARVTAIYFALPYARSTFNDENAFALVLLGLQDKAKLPRYWACRGAADAMRPEALPALRRLAEHSDPETREWAERATRAIEKKEAGEFVGPGVKATWAGATQDDDILQLLAGLRDIGIDDTDVTIYD